MAVVGMIKITTNRRFGGSSMTKDTLEKFFERYERFFMQSLKDAETIDKMKRQAQRRTQWER